MTYPAHVLAKSRSKQQEQEKMKGQVRTLRGIQDLSELMEVKAGIMNLKRFKLSLNSWTPLPTYLITRPLLLTHVNCSGFKIGFPDTI